MAVGLVLVFMKSRLVWLIWFTERVAISAISVTEPGFAVKQPHLFQHVLPHCTTPAARLDLPEMDSRSTNNLVNIWGHELVFSKTKLIALTKSPVKPHAGTLFLKSGAGHRLEFPLTGMFYKGLCKTS